MNKKQKSSVKTPVKTLRRINLIFRDFSILKRSLMEELIIRRTHNESLPDPVAFLIGDILKGGLSISCNKKWLLSLKPIQHLT